MLKHVHISPMKKGSDTMSICSSTSFTSSLCNSLGTSNEFDLKSSSRSSSVSSLTCETVPQVILKVYTACLKQDIEYKTLNVSWDTNAYHIVKEVLRKCKIKHRDPKLFYLSMEMRFRRADQSCSIALENTSKPAMLQNLHPPGESEFHLKIKTGGPIKIFTSLLSEETQYRSLVISEETTSDEVIFLLLSFFNLNEPVEDYSIYQVCPNQEYQRKLHPDDLPLRVQYIRNSKGESCHFLVRKVHQRPISLSLDATRFMNIEMNSTNTKDEIVVSSRFQQPPMYSSSLSILKSKFNKIENCLSKLSLRNQTLTNDNNNSSRKQQRLEVNNYNLMHSEENQRQISKQKSQTNLNNNNNNNSAKSSNQQVSERISYSPVYCVREIKLSEFENSFL